MTDHAQAAAMLKILLATCHTTLDTLKAADNPVDDQLITDLETMIERTHRELQKLTDAQLADPSP